MSDTERTILQAAANLLREQGLARVAEARSLNERDCANAALQASVTIDRYLSLADDMDRPF